MHKVVNTVI